MKWIFVDSKQISQLKRTKARAKQASQSARLKQNRDKAAGRQAGIEYALKIIERNQAG